MAEDEIVLLESQPFGTVAEADRVVVTSGGAIVEEGTHEALLATTGIFTCTYLLQAESFR